VSVAHPRTDLAREHVGRWTVDDVMALPENGIRYEVVDGALIVNPPPSPSHQDVSFLLHRMLHDAARTAGRRVRIWEAVGLTLPDEQLLIPDIVVARGNASRASWPLIQPADVLLTVEIVSPGSRTRDRTEKPYLYAEAGIPHFWRVELGNFRGRTERLPVVFAHALGEDGEYRLVQRVGAGTAFTVDEPLPVTFDPADLVED